MLTRNLLSLIAIVIFFSTVLTSCTLHSVYDDKRIKFADKLCINIESGSSVESAEFYNYLSEMLPHCIENKYNLIVSFSNSIVPSIIKKNSDTLRQTISQTVEYRLLGINDNKIFTFGKFTNVTSYNENMSPYSAYTENEYASEILAYTSAEEIRNRLVLFFSQSSL